MKWLMLLVCMGGVAAASSVVTAAQEARLLPDMPEPKPAIERYEAPKPVIQVRFWDTHAKVAAAANVGLLAADSAITCNNLAHGGHENWSPAKSCGGVVSLMVAEHAALWVGAYLLHRHHHDRAARVAEWVGVPWNVAGMAYSTSHDRALNLVCTEVRVGFSRCKIE